MNALQIAHEPLRPEILEAVAQGDIGKLTAAQRVVYYNLRCERVGLDPITKPFDYIVLNDKLTLYANKNAAEGLRKVHKISLAITAREHVLGLYIVTAQAEDRDGRRDESIGAVSVDNLKGEALANALMKAETKAKRRVTFAICGLGMLDETEVEDIPASAKRSVPPEPKEAPKTALSAAPPPAEPEQTLLVDTETGEVADEPTLLGYAEQKIGFADSQAIQEPGFAGLQEPAASQAPPSMAEVDAAFENEPPPGDKVTDKRAVWLARKCRELGMADPVRHAKLLQLFANTARDGKGKISLKALNAAQQAEFYEVVKAQWDPEKKRWRK